MAESTQLTARKREGRGSKLAERLRKQGLVPAVVYGHKEATISVAIPRDEFAAVLRHGQRIVDLQTDGHVQKTLIRDIQWDALGQEVLHVDFARVSADERIEIDVTVELRGTAPGATAGGVVDHVLHHVAIECLAMNVPESIRVSLNELQVGQAIHVKDLKLPEGVKVLEDPEAIVVHVLQPAAEPEAAPTEVVETAEPEVIKREKPEEEAGE
jgi:large subunit ribosomal protein L25